MHDGFPHRYTPETALPRWQQFRAEGKSLRESVLNTFSYVRKAIYKKHSGPVESLQYFDGQRQLFRHLMNEPTPANATRVALVGDIMWIRDGWDAFLDQGVLDYLNAHDVVLGNLESVISSRFKIPSLLPDYLTYNSHRNLVAAFRRPDGRNTFSALSLSNNHALDRGELGARDTQHVLGELSIPHSGVQFDKETRPYTVFEANGIRFGFYATAFGLNAFIPPNPNVIMNALPAGVFDAPGPVDLPEVRRVLADMAADGCDIRVVAPHWGYEYEYYPCPGVMRVGHEIVRAGADIVLGTHPHVQQPCETLFLNGYEEQLPDAARELAKHSTLTADGPPRKAIVAYSMGNFTTTMFTFACKIGWILGLRMFKNPGTGRTDWTPEPAQFVLNVPRFGKDRTRRLLMLEDYHKHAKQHDGPTSYERRHLEYVAKHVSNDE